MREMDMERKAHYAMNRFVTKHTSGVSAESTQRPARDNRGNNSLLDTGAVEGYTSRYLEGAASEPQSLLETPRSWAASGGAGEGGSGGRSLRRGASTRRKQPSPDDTLASEAISGVVGLSDALVGYISYNDMSDIAVIIFE